MKHTDFQKLLTKAKANRDSFLAPYKSDFDSLTLEMQQTEDENTKRRLFKNRAKIIIDLIKLEPSHKDEPWIAEELTEWLRRHDCKDFTEEAFLAQKGRRRPTEKQQEQWAKDFFLVEEVDKIIAEAKAKRERIQRLTEEAYQGEWREYKWHQTEDEGSIDSPRKEIEQLRRGIRISKEWAFRTLANRVRSEEFDEIKIEPSTFIPNLDSHHNPDAQIKAVYYRHQKRNKRKLSYPYYGYDITEKMLQGRMTKMVIEIGGQKIPVWGDWKI